MVEEKLLKGVSNAVLEQELYDGMYGELYARLSNMPEDAIRQMLKELIPPAALFSRVDGTMFRIRALGLTMFDTKMMLEQAGIGKSDPRSKMFKYMKGSLIEEELVNEMRNIAAKQNTVAKQVGGIPIQGDDHRSKQWWVPVNATSAFVEAIENLTAEFQGYVKEKIIDQYETLKTESHRLFTEGVEEMWTELSAAGKAGDLTRKQFISSNEAFFNSQFPTQSDVENKILMQYFPVQAALPDVVEQTVTEVRDALRNRALALQQEADAAAQMVQQQLRIGEIAVQMKEMTLQAARNKEAEERALRAELLKKQIAPEIQRTQGLVLQMQTSFMKLSQQVLEHVKSGKKISAAQRRAWRATISQLQSLTTADTEQFEKALEMISSVSESTETTDVDIKTAEIAVTGALQEIEKNASVSMKADALWVLMRAGKSNEAMSKIYGLRAKLQESMGTLETLEEIAAKIGGQNMLIENGLAREDNNNNDEN
jgi:hypothetical protein